MENNISMINSKGAKAFFWEVMDLPVKSRELFIKKHSPNMRSWQKKPRFGRVIRNCT